MRLHAPDADSAADRLAEADQMREEGRLTRSIAPHQRDDFSGLYRKIDSMKRGDGPVRRAKRFHNGNNIAGDHLASTEFRRAVGQPITKGAGNATSIANGKRKRIPSGETPQFHNRRSNDRCRKNFSWGTHHHRTAITWHHHDAIGILNHSFEAMLSDQDGDPEIVDESCQCCEHFLCSSRIERRCGFVEDKHSWARRENSPNRNSLLLTTRQRREWTIAQVVQTEQIKDVLDSSTHHVGGNTKVFHGICQFVLDEIGNETRRWVLPNNSYDLS
jgi:hypothetical protein